MGAVGVLWLAVDVSAQTSDQPLSAIDWLSQSAAALDAETAETTIIEPPVAGNAATPEISVSSLDAPSPDTIGLFPSGFNGFPKTIWAMSTQADLIALIGDRTPYSLPVMQELLQVLLLIEADAPKDATANGALFLARIDRLIADGSIETAQAMLDLASPKTRADVFQRWFDLALLTQTQDKACAAFQASPQLAPSASARIFCLARVGDWQTAALTLNTQRVLGDIPDEEEDLLARFLDPELYEDNRNLRPPSDVTPLIFNLRSAIGESLPTSNLALAYVHSDLRDTVGWKSRLEAAERLARAGVISDNLLLGIYTDRRPSASGGVWDRAKAIQRFDKAIEAQDDLNAISQTLLAAWHAAQKAKIEVPFARLYAQELIDLTFDDDVMPVVLNIGLLSSQYEEFALKADASFLTALARGFPDGAAPASAHESAIYDGFTDAGPDPQLAHLLTQGKLGEAILRNLDLLEVGAAGDTQALSRSLALFRSVGLEDFARRAALQILILERIR